MIAGAEDGVGRGYADVLAGKGMNVFLVSVTHADLEDFAQEISKYTCSESVIIVIIYFEVIYILLFTYLYQCSS